MKGEEGIEGRRRVMKGAKIERAPLHPSERL
jgi:hypothetical protein